MKEIYINSIENVRIGQAEDVSAGTGITVVISDSGAPAGLEIRGGGPAARESGVLSPLANADKIHAIVLAGGSAFGLDAAGGVMKYLEERGIGYPVGVTHVPIVCQSDLFDLTVASADVRPDADMAYRACLDSENGVFQCGNHGAGTGATVGKYCLMQHCMKSGIGSYAVQAGELQVGAIVAVNALGDVFDSQTHRQIAGLLTEDHRGLRRTTDVMYEDYSVVSNKFTGNTTLGVVLTNAAFDKTKLCKIACMAGNGIVRSIDPVNTTADGDSIYAMSVGNVSADQDFVGTLATEVVSRAIDRAIMCAESAYGFPAARDLPINK